MPLCLLKYSQSPIFFMFFPLALSLLNCAISKYKISLIQVNYSLYGAQQCHLSQPVRVCDLLNE